MWLMAPTTVLATGMGTQIPERAPISLMALMTSGAAVE